MINFNKNKIAIIGLGYVGLPLAVEFSKKFKVFGFDINTNRLNELRNFKDTTLEITPQQLKSLIILKSNNSLKSGLYLTNKLPEISNCNIFIVTVPTPVDHHNHPQLTPLLKATEYVASVLKKGDYVIYESTVYPGVTEDECVKVLEKNTNFKLNKDFFVGYSPERINPGDKEHTLSKIIKVTSGSTPAAATFIDNLYKTIIIAVTFKSSSIKVAEAAKVIENSQRDINIAFINELSKIFNLLDIDTRDVLNAAKTKWNFMNFLPGLVGGHCIGVDPYYLAQKAQEVGYHPEIILAGRRLNDQMGKYISEQVIKLMVKKNLKIKNSKVLILGFTFKENCPDFRNTKVIDIYNELNAFDINVKIFDPLVNRLDVKNEFGISIIKTLNEKTLNQYSAIILAVAHNSFKKIKLDSNKNCVIYDVKGFFDKNLIDARL
jgi:UDP-N-acetyl-D-galactosamine dehydrogenase